MTLDVAPERWLLRCPVDEAVIAPAVSECTDCGLDTAPLRALAGVAAGQLRLAAGLEPDSATAQVEAAAALVPESENFLLDCARTLRAANALEPVLDALKRANAIAPGRRDIKALLDEVDRSIDPTAWLAKPPVQTAASRTEHTVRLAVAPAPSAATPRSRLMAEHASARSLRDCAAIGSDAYRSACLDVAQIEVRIAALALEASAAA